jgi:hypothetical protein
MQQANKGKWAGRLFRGSVLLALISLGVAWIAGDGAPARDVESVAAQGWGAESLAEAQAGLRQLSPIALANACGMGASSCFKCHNGKRAAAPNMDAGKAPWHAQHKKVNNSCVGCHKGNPRIMKEDLAHAGMLKGPKGGQEACGSCHTSDLAKVEAMYKSVTGGSK